MDAADEAYRYWGTSETLLPVYQDAAKAMAKHPDVDTVVNFASSRSVYSSTMELMQYPQIKSIAIIAEGVPERVCDHMRHNTCTITHGTWHVCHVPCAVKFFFLPAFADHLVLARS